MRRAGGILVATVFVLLAAILGWYLPMAVFSFDDTLNEKKQMELDIERINLTYRDDLSIAQKIDITNFETMYEDYIELEKGIFIQEEDVQKIVSDFLADFTGFRFNFSVNNFYAVPQLVNLTNNKGTIVIWTITCWVEPSWTFVFGIDDKTGAILRFGMSGSPDNWDSAFDDFYRLNDPYEDLIERYRNAIYNHYSDRIDAKFITMHQVQEWSEEDTMGYRLVFRDNRDDTFELTVNISLSEGYIETF